jgi:ferritin
MGMNSMVSQRKSEKSSQQQIAEYLANVDSQKTVSNTADTADELVHALDTLLLERAVEEHRDALTRLNKLTHALDDRGAGDTKK